MPEYETPAAPDNDEDAKEISNAIKWFEENEAYLETYIDFTVSENNAAEYLYRCVKKKDWKNALLYAHIIRKHWEAKDFQ